MTTRAPAKDIVGVILAGGQARRMGAGDKALVELGGKTLLERTLERATPQVDELLINANGDPARFAPFHRQILPDAIQGHLGPLAGILTGLEWMKANRPDARWLASFPCDTPFFPRDLVARLVDKAQSERVLVAVAMSGGRRHSVFAVWSADINETADGVLLQRSLRKMDDFIDSLPHARVEFPIEPFDPFFNINTFEDLRRAEELVSR